MRDVLTVVIVFGLMFWLAIHEFVFFVRDLWKNRSSRIVYTEFKSSGRGVAMDVKPVVQLALPGKKRKFVVNVEACEAYLKGSV